MKFQITVPARWAWHDHAEASRRVHGAAYATYVGAYKSRFRFTEGEALVTRYDVEGIVRSFCARCGSPLLYERPRAPEMVNIPRALFLSRTGREPRYHLNIDETPDWAYAGEPLKPLAMASRAWSGPGRSGASGAFDRLRQDHQRKDLEQHLRPDHGRVGGRIVLRGHLDHVAADDVGAGAVHAGSPAPASGVRPPASEKPVPGAKAGSSPSTSKEM